MNEAFENLLSRRSVKGYKPDMVPEEIIEQIIQAGLYAASGMNRQDTVILAVTRKETRDQLSALNARVRGFDKDPFYGAPVVLVVLADKGCGTYLYDGSLTMGNLMNGAHALGVDSCWIHGAKEEFEDPEGKALLKELGLTGDYEGIGHCILGYRQTEYPAAAPRKENRVFYIK